ncbi:jg28022, partial [Pararge aegeria aegeria]
MRSSSGSALVDHRLGLKTLNVLLGAAGHKQHKNVVFGAPSRGRPLVDMMMMTLIQTYDNDQPCR